MSITIESLDIQIKSSAGSAAKNIDDLAKALGNLNANAKVTKITNSLNSLNTALSNMKSQQAVMSHLSALSKSLSGLASIPKLTGLQSAIRELKKLPEVAASLDTAQIAQFTGKIKLLASGLSPLATQIDKIGTGFSKLPPQVSKCVTAVKRLDSANKSVTKSTNAHSNALNSQSFNLLATYEHLSNVFSMIHGIQNAITKILNDAIQWDGIQARFGRAFGDSAQESLAWVDKLSESLMINKQEFMQYSSLFAEMLSGFGVNQADAGKMAIGYTELAYDIWAAYNDVYKSLGGEEGAIAAVRSAIAGEVEPIRRAGFTIVDSQLAVTAANHGLTYSTQKATEAQKSYLRYVTMVDQAIDKNVIGVYAAEMQTAEGAVRTLSQQFKALGQAVGSLFLPILQNVLPYLTVFVQLLYDAAEAIAAFFGLPFFETNWGRGVDNSGLADFAQSADASTEALGGAADAAKKLKQYTMGFDELNVITPSSDASGGSAGGGAGDGSGWDRMDVDSVWDESLFKQASQQIDDLKEKVKAYIEEHKVMLTVVGSVAAFLTLAKAIRGLNALFGITKTWGMLVTTFNGITSAITKMRGAINLMSAFFGTLRGGQAATSALAFMSPVLSTIANALVVATKAVAAFVGGLTAGPILAIVGIITAIVSVVVFLKRNWEEVTAAVKEFFNTNIVPKLESIKESWEKIKKVLVDALPESWISWFKVVAVLISALVARIGEWFKSVDWIKAIGDVFEWVGDVIFTVISTVIAGALSAGITLFEGFSQTVSGIVQVVTGVVRAIVALFSGDLTEAWDAVKLFGAGIVDVFEGMKTMTLGVIQNFVSGAVKWFSDFPSKALQPIKTFCDSVKQKFVELWDSVKAWFNIHVAPKFTAAFWLNKFDGIKEGFKLAIKNAVNAGITLMNKFIGWINEKLSFSWDSFEIAGKEIVPAGSIQLFTIPQIPRLEKGGFLEDGLFTMNHGEIAGKFNNGKSVVANNQQIVEGIAAGVYEAVVAAMNATSGRGEQSVNVYLDGKQIATAVEKRQSERGRTLMGNQLGYVY